MDKKRLQQLVLEIRKHMKTMPENDMARIYERLQAIKNKTIVYEQKDKEAENTKSTVDYLEEK